MELMGEAIFWRVPQTVYVKITTPIVSNKSSLYEWPDRLVLHSLRDGSQWLREEHVYEISPVHIIAQTLMLGK
jgi:hypothetical protein